MIAAETIPPGHGERPSEESLALCGHPATRVVDGWIRCSRCGGTLGRPPDPVLTVEWGDDQWPAPSFEDATRRALELIAERDDPETGTPQIREQQGEQERVWHLVDDERGAWQASRWRP